MEGPKICFLSGLPIQPGDMSIEHYVPRSRADIMYTNQTANKFPAIKIINFIKGDLLPCEWRILYQHRMEYALNNWRLKPKQKRTIALALDKMRGADMRNVCEMCVLRTNQTACDIAREKYNIKTR